MYDRVVVLETEQRGTIVDMTREGLPVVELDDGQLLPFDPFDLEVCNPA